MEWKNNMSMSIGLEMGTSTYNNSGAGGGATVQYPMYMYGALPSVDTLHIDDLLDFSNQEVFSAGGDGHAALVPPAETPCSMFSSQSSSFDIYIPHEEAAELEWLSKFVDDSFSDVPNYQFNMNIIPNTGGGVSKPLVGQSTATTGRGSRSKRSRATALWSSPAQPSPSPSPSSSSSSSSEFPLSKTKSGNNGDNSGVYGDSAGLRRCTHCASEKTPQWRTGPLGPKTLCNACGVRYKSGRLVPEYRPAASPTFVLTQHSNSHRKVMELRRQKELVMNSNATAAAVAAAQPLARPPEMMYNEYGVC